MYSQLACYLFLSTFWVSPVTMLQDKLMFWSIDFGVRHSCLASFLCLLHLIIFLYFSCHLTSIYIILCSFLYLQFRCCQLPCSFFRWICCDARQNEPYTQQPTLRPRLSLFHNFILINNLIKWPRTKVPKGK